ncbi:MAG: thioredoxin-dependent thiol peroxidase [Cellvibrionales bacterium]|nr:thioredoxin-dependent thiol peroxidase [Cellvibrionales bacterium]
MAFPQIGAPAPDFSLADQHGDLCTLADCRGRWVVLYFYPKAMTPGCTVQACGLSEQHAALEAAGALAIGISPDPVARLAKFAEKHRLAVRLLSDADHAVAEQYGVWGLKKFMGREYMGILRTTFIIDEQGRVAHSMDRVRTKTHDQDVLAWLADNAKNR